MYEMSICSSLSDVTFIPQSLFFFLHVVGNGHHAEGKAACQSPHKENMAGPPFIKKAGFVREIIFHPQKINIK